MTRQILAIHGAGTPATQRGSVYWKAKLEDALGADYTVTSPIMPRPEEPQYAGWREKIEESVAPMEDGLILLGHSLGGSVLLKWLSEGVLKRPIGGLFILAAPYWSKATGWESDEFGLPDDFAARLPIAPVCLYHSRDDEEVPFAHLSYYSEQLPHAVIRALDGQGHEFRRGDTPELTQDIRSVAATVTQSTRSIR
jgi:predicted alpha/beta hydrolase family esterase